MNIFPIEHRNNESLSSWCERIAASHQCIHQKLILELHQMLNTNCNVLGIKTDNPSVAYKNHPCTIWMRSSKDNWDFSIELAKQLAISFKERNNKADLHKSYVRIQENIPCAALIDALPSIGLTPFAMAMPEELRCSDPVEAYKRYYQECKSWFARKDTKSGLYKAYPATWKNKRPEWFEPRSLDYVLDKQYLCGWQGSKRVVITKDMLINYDEVR